MVTTSRRKELQRWVVNCGGTAVKIGAQIIVLRKSGMGTNAPRGSEEKVFLVGVFLIDWLQATFLQQKHIGNREYNLQCKPVESNVVYMFTIIWCVDLFSLNASSLSYHPSYCLFSSNSRATWPLIYLLHNHYQTNTPPLKPVSPMATLSNRPWEQLG